MQYMIPGNIYFYKLTTIAEFRSMKTLNKLKKAYSQAFRSIHGFYHTIIVDEVI